MQMHLKQDTYQLKYIKIIIKERTNKSISLLIVQQIFEKKMNPINFNIDEVNTNNYCKDNNKLPSINIEKEEHMEQDQSQHVPKLIDLVDLNTNYGFNNGVKLNFNQKALKHLFDLLDNEKKICAIMVTGLAGAGKSTMLNSIARFIDNSLRNDQFPVGKQQYTETRGIKILNNKLIYKNVQIVLFDCEGQNGTYPKESDETKIFHNTQQQENYFKQLFTLSFLIPQVLLIHSNQRILQPDLKSVEQLSKIQAQFNKIKSFQLPLLRWNIRDGLKTNNIDKIKSTIVNQCEDKSFIENIEIVLVTKLYPKCDILLNLPFCEQIQVMLDKIVCSSTLKSKSEIIERLNDIEESIESCQIEDLITQKYQQTQAINIWKCEHKLNEFNIFQKCFDEHYLQGSSLQQFNKQYQNLMILLNHKLKEFFKEQRISLPQIISKASHTIIQDMNISYLCSEYVQKIEKQRQQVVKDQHNQLIEELNQRYNALKEEKASLHLLQDDLTKAIQKQELENEQIFNQFQLQEKEDTIAFESKMQKAREQQQITLKEIQQKQILINDERLKQFTKGLQEDSQK